MYNAMLITIQHLGLLLEYFVCFVIIVISLLALGFLRRRTKKEMCAETVRKSCEKAKAYAEAIFDDVKHKGTYILLGSTKLGHLSGLISDACWYAYQIVHSQRDIIFEGSATSLDTLASEISIESDDGYIPAGEYQAYLKKTIVELESIIQKLDAITAETKI